jgi:hypothetical protein
MFVTRHDSQLGSFTRTAFLGKDVCLLFFLLLARILGTKGVPLLSFASAKESFVCTQDKISKEKQSRFPRLRAFGGQGCCKSPLRAISSAKIGNDKLNSIEHFL